MGTPSLPASLNQEFEVVEAYRGDSVLYAFLVKERGGALRELIIRLLAPILWGEEALVAGFHEFFVRFAQISNRTYIPKVYSVSGALHAPVYVLEEYCSGQPLSALVSRGGDIAQALSRICEALHYAHQKNIFHLSISQEHILIGEPGGAVKVSGFGAQVFVAAGRLDALPADTKKLMAPEVLAGKPYNASADVYSLAQTINEICPWICSGTDALAKALSPNPADRFQKIRDFETVLADILLSGKTPYPYESPKLVESPGGLKPAADICLRTEPTGAVVTVDGRSEGATTETGLVIPWKRGMQVRVKKPGYEKETIHFTSRPKDRDITLSLKPLLVNVKTNPPGSAVTVNGQFVGTAGADGLGVPWDKGEITVEKKGFRKETFRFESVPTLWEVNLNLTSYLPWYSVSHARVKFAIAAPLLLLGVFAGLAVHYSQDDKGLAIQQNEAQRVAALEQEKREKEREIAALKEAQLLKEQERGRQDRARIEAERFPASYCPWFSSFEYQSEFDRQLKRGYYPVKVEGTEQSGKIKFRAIFVPFPQGDFYFVSHHGLESRIYNKKNKEYLSKGLIQITHQSFQTSDGRFLHQATWTNQKTLINQSETKIDQIPKRLE
jgi:serine/threonine protein kinase